MQSYNLMCARSKCSLLVTIRSVVGSGRRDEVAVLEKFQHLRKPTFIVVQAHIEVITACLSLISQYAVIQTELVRVRSIRTESDCDEAAVAATIPTAARPAIAALSSAITILQPSHHRCMAIQPGQ